MSSKTITIQPHALLRRYSTSYWKNYANMWDGNASSSYCSSPDYTTSSSTDSRTGYFLISLSSIPKNATITSIRYRAYIYRNGSSNNLRVKVGTSTTDTSSGTRTDVTTFSSLPTSSYNTIQEVSVSQSISSTQSASLLSASYVYLGLCGTNSQSSYDYIYEIYVDITYSVGGTVLYDTEFDYAKWKEKGITAGTGSISNITDTGFTMTANANDTYTGESHVFKLEEGQTYTIKYDTSGDSSNECFVFFHSSESAGWSSFKNSTQKQFDFEVPSGYPYCTIRVDVNNSGQTITFSNFLIVKASESWRLSTISSYTARRNTDSWNFPSASRTGYTLSGWKDKNGTAYTSSSAYPSDDIVLYSQWTAQTRTISTGVTPAGSGSVTGGGTYTYGSQVTLTAIPANGYRFVQWSDGITVNPRTVYATINVTVSAIFEALSKIFVGNNRASASYVGTAKASAVYVGATRVL